MRVIRVRRNRVSVRALAEAERVLGAGGVVAFPTETSYGLAADPRNAAAVLRVFAVKGRPAGKALPCVAADATAAARVCVLNGATAKLAKQHWPGALTMVLAVRGGTRLLLDGKSAAADVAVRVPRSVWARAIARAAGGLATSTSANLSGDAAIYSGAAVVKQFRGRADAPDLVLDAGLLPKRPASTIVKVAADGAVTVLRQGAKRVGSERA